MKTNGRRLSTRTLIILIITLVLFSGAAIGTYIFLRNAGTAAAANLDENGIQALNGTEGTNTEEGTETPEPTEDVPSEETQATEGAGEEEIPATEGATSTTTTTPETSTTLEESEETTIEQERIIWEETLVGWRPLNLNAAALNYSVFYPVIGIEKTSKAYNGKTELTATNSEGYVMVHNGDTIDYVITITNIGNGAGTVDIKDILPEAVELIGDITVTGSGDSYTITEEDLAAGVTIAVPAGINGETPSIVTISFTVEVKGKIRDIIFNVANDDIEDEVIYEIIDSEISVGKSSYISESNRKTFDHKVVPGTVLTYEIVVTNSGNEAGSTVITDAIPERVAYLGNVSIDGVSIDTLELANHGITLEENNQIITQIKWEVIVPAAIDEQTPSEIVLTFQVIVKDYAPQFHTTAPRRIINSVYKDGELEDSVTDYVYKPIILKDKTSVPVPETDYVRKELVENETGYHYEVKAGTKIKYTITVENVGSKASDEIVVTDNIPDGTTYVAESMNATLYDVNGDTVSTFVFSMTDEIDALSGKIESLVWSDFTLGVREKAVLEFEVIVNALTETPPYRAPIERNIAAVNSDTPNVPDDNTYEVVKPNIEVTKTSAQASTTQGEKVIDLNNPQSASNPIIYTITIKNTGEIADTVNVTDNIAKAIEGVNATIGTPNTTVTGYTGTVPDATLNNGVLTWNGTVYPGEIITVTVSVSVTGIKSGNIATVANYVHYEWSDSPTGGSNTPTIYTDVKKAEIVGLKDNTPKGSVEVGTNITYTITASNIGAATDSNVTIYDKIPTGTEYVGPLTITSNVNGSNFTPENWLFDNSNMVTGVANEVSYINGTVSLEPGEAVTVTFVVKVLPAAYENPDYIVGETTHSHAIRNTAKVGDKVTNEVINTVSEYTLTQIEKPTDPLNITILFDTSLSMGTPSGKLTSAKNAANEFLNGIMNLSPQSNIRLVEFNVNAKTYSEATTTDAIKNVINGWYYTNSNNTSLVAGTNIYAGLTAAREVMQDMAGNGRKNILVYFGDGYAQNGTGNNSIANFATLNADNNLVDIAKSIEAIGNNNTEIYTVAYELSDTNNTNVQNARNLLNKVASPASQVVNSTKTHARAGTMGDISTILTVLAEDLGGREISSTNGIFKIDISKLDTNRNIIIAVNSISKEYAYAQLVTGINFNGSTVTGTPEIQIVGNYLIWDTITHRLKSERLKLEYFIK